MVRPPGAVDEATFLQRCTKCEDCMALCPHGAIGMLDRGPAKGTPAMNVNQAPCHLCEDLPCVAACETGALLPMGLDTVFFGLARIVESKCFVFMGPECGACVPVCPVKAMKTVAGKPVVDEEVCNGCGLCKAACPVFGSAIVIDV